MAKIGLDARMFGAIHGGIGRYCKELFLRVPEIDPSNKYVIFFNPKNLLPEDQAALYGLKNVILRPAPIRHYSLLEQTAFLRNLNREALDLVHFPNFNVPLYYRGKFVVTIHDMVHHKISGHKKKHLLHFYAYKKIIASAALRANRILTVSQCSRHDIGQILQVPENKIEVIYEGAGIGQFPAQERIEEVKRKFILNRPYFLFVGVMERKKNLITLARAFDSFIQKFGLDMDLVMVGRVDPHYPEIKHKILDIKAKQRIVLTDQVTQEELESLYAGAYAFVSASLHEGFGLPGVEAMAYGLPLAVSNTPVFNEIYDNAAVYFNPVDINDIAEKLNLLARDLNFRQQLAEKSLARSELFNWDNAARETVAVYNQSLLSDGQERTEK